MKKSEKKSDTSPFTSHITGSPLTLFGVTLSRDRSRGIPARERFKEQVYRHAMGEDLANKHPYQAFRSQLYHLKKTENAKLSPSQENMAHWEGFYVATLERPERQPFNRKLRQLPGGFTYPLQPVFHERSDRAHNYRARPEALITLFIDEPLEKRKSLLSLPYKSNEESVNIKVSISQDVGLSDEIKTMLSLDHSPLVALSLLANQDCDHVCLENIKARHVKSKAPSSDQSPLLDTPARPKDIMPILQGTLGSEGCRRR